MEKMPKYNTNERNRVSKSLSWDPEDLDDCMTFLREEKNNLPLSEWIRQLVNDALADWRATHKKSRAEEFADFLVGVATLKGGIEKVNVNEMAAEFRSLSANDFVIACKLAKEKWTQQQKPAKTPSKPSFDKTPAQPIRLPAADPNAMFSDADDDAPGQEERA